jgi:hypothetical protein
VIGDDEGTLVLSRPIGNDASTFLQLLVASRWASQETKFRLDR